MIMRCTVLFSAGKDEREQRIVFIFDGGRVMILVLFGVVILICGVALFIILLKKKLNGKIFLGILSIVLIAIISSVIYVSIGKNVQKNHVMEYLENNGYSQSQILSIKAQHSFLNIILGYQEWGVEIVFADEPDISYGYRYDSKEGVTQGGVSGGDMNTKKEDLKHIEK